MPKRPLPLFVRLALFTGLLLTGACRTPRESGGPPHRAEPPVSLAGESRFFGDKLFVAATLRTTERPRIDGRSAETDGRRRHPGGGPRRMQDDPDQPAGWRMRAARGPTLTLKIALTNTSTETLTVVIRDVKSELGNFAARPERVTLAPQQSVELDPMFPLADSVVGNIPLTLGLRSADQNEAQTVMLQPAPPPAPPPPAPPPAD